MTKKTETPAGYGPARGKCCNFHKDNNNLDSIKQELLISWRNALLSCHQKGYFHSVDYQKLALDEWAAALADLKGGGKDENDN